MPGPRRPRVHSVADLLGAVYGLLCGLHCALVPLLMATVPAFTLALHSFRDPWHGTAVWLLRSLAWENTLVLSAVALCALSLALGWRRHRRYRPALWLGAACIAFAFGLFAPIRTGSPSHALALVAGGLLLAAAHLNNWRLLRADDRVGRYTVSLTGRPTHLAPDQGQAS